jgi:hypothetical protein
MEEPGLAYVGPRYRKSLQSCPCCLDIRLVWGKISMVRIQDQTELDTGSTMFVNVKPNAADEGYYRMSGRNQP